MRDFASLPRIVELLREGSDFLPRIPPACSRYWMRQVKTVVATLPSVSVAVTDTV